jgi:hypothetical protein
MNILQPQRTRQALRSALIIATAMIIGLIATVGSAQATVKTDVAAARAALSRATTRAGAGDVAGTTTALTTVRSHTRHANTGAKALIGAPPTDPESDDVPGPPAVTAALKLDAAIVSAVVPLYGGSRAGTLAGAFNSTLRRAQASRMPMLQQVAGLPPEGAGADYADGMADMLPLFNKEVKVLTTGLQGAPATGKVHAGLTNALARATQAQKIVKKAWGGGERPAA